MLLLCMPLSLVVIRRAKAAPPNRTRLHAIVGWISGFLIVDAVLLTPIFILMWMGKA
jgi:hypothetical protein